MDFRLFQQMKGLAPEEQQQADQQGRLSLGLGLLAASGSSQGSFNERLAGGIAQGLHGYRQAVSDIMSGRKEQREAELQQMQLEQAQQQNAMAQSQAQARQAYQAMLAQKDPNLAALFGVAPSVVAESQAPLSQAQQAQLAMQEAAARQAQANADRSYGLDAQRLQLAKAEAGRKGNLELKEVVMPDGSIRYLDEQSALGQMVPPKSGMNIRTNPDGTMEFVQGPGAGSLTTKTSGEVWAPTTPLFCVSNNCTHSHTKLSQPN